LSEWQWVVVNWRYSSGGVHPSNWSRRWRDGFSGRLSERAFVIEIVNWDAGSSDGDEGRVLAESRLLGNVTGITPQTHLLTTHSY